MTFNGMTLCRVPGQEDQFMIILLDTQLHNPFTETSIPLSRDEASNKLREMKVPEDEIESLFVQAKPCWESQGSEQ